MSIILAKVSLLLTLQLAYAGEQGKTLLAFGDSLAAGQLPGFIFRSGEGYNDYLFEHLQQRYGFDSLVDSSCTGDSAANALNATFGLTTCDRESPPFYSFCYFEACLDDVFRPLLEGTSQVDAAERYMMDHPGEVGLITISIGSNDFSDCIFVDNIQACVFAAFPDVSKNLPEILSRLGTFGVPIVGSNTFNPIIAFSLSDDPAIAELGPTTAPLFPIVNGLFEDIYQEFNCSFVDFFAVVNGNIIDEELANVCRKTGMCNEANDGTLELTPELDFTDHQHPNELGYDLIGQAFVDVVDSTHILPTESPTMSSVTFAPTASPPVSLAPIVQPVAPSGKKNKKSGKKHK
eukprot:CAMPEP_0194247204 /NCGR_PEP_ID=MMETSP0158-20130606/16217_1 /TAXON_ID=33649 /ORGANISM="Thalassionema nitzschioides, Strain L26-B" /LENGTH=347 /DNA_ID=CAMNT_0038983263 /DNA_START=35 /DNA_END=1075 /DNA_ORIENTATION=+